ncbi:unnamed protein product [Tetraodon nigroviridis]|uniref:(spotted green pufferfish) hypothetical protein n=1 Tax=Tetraodon nigroviridis TaxID=99883 RepID=Q4RRT0_TETNG|nr:unnamed protein product [Tetraodon nigroviridis]
METQVDMDCWDQLIQVQLSGSGDWPPCDAQAVEIPRAEMEVVKGQMAVLHAWYSPGSDISKNSVTWQIFGNGTKPVINFSSGQVGYGQNEFTKRVGFSVAMPSANLSFYINDTQESDSGLYVCIVIIPGAPSISGQIQLNVKVPPSPPVCSLTGSPVVKGNVTLSCKSSQGKPVPQYKWTKAAPTSEPVLVLGFMGGGRYTVTPMLRRRRRLLLDERHGTLRLSNLTKGMSGKYICRASNTAGTDSCSINLEVITSSNGGVIAAATLGSIVGLVAMVLFLIFILRKKRDTEEEIANEIKEDALAPKRISWAKSTTGSDVLSKNGTLSSIATSPRPRDPHQPNFHYPYSPAPASDSSVINAYQLRPGQANTLQGLPGYNLGGTPSRKHKQPSANGGPPQALRSPVVPTPNRTDGAQPQMPPLAASPQTSSSTLTRTGAVAIMVPAQSQAGSLV